MRICKYPGCWAKVPSIWPARTGPQSTIAVEGGWLKPLCSDHATEVPVEFVIQAISRKNTTVWATPIDMRPKTLCGERNQTLDKPDEDEDAITTLQDLMSLISENPDLIHGGVGLTGTDPLIHTVRAGLVRMGTELMRSEKLQAKDLSESKPRSIE